MDISSVVLAYPSQDDGVIPRKPDDSTAHVPLFPPVDFTLLKIFKLGLTRDVCQIPFRQNRHAIPPETLSYTLGLGLTCEVTRHELAVEEVTRHDLGEGEVDPSFKVRAGQAIALKRYFPTNTEDGHSPEKHIARVSRLLSQELEVFCHPLLKEHPNIVQLQFIGWEHGSLIPVLGLELAAFGTLDDFLSSADLSSTRHTITDWERLRATADITFGLQTLHACGFTHGDLKPGNILVQQHEELGLRFKLSDFSGAHSFSNGDTSISHERHGTPAWMAPEELSIKVISDWCMSDVYSYGLLIVTLWHNHCSKPGFPVECYLALHVPRAYQTTDADAGGGTTSNNEVSTFNSLKMLEDDDTNSPRRLAMSDFARHPYSIIISTIAHHSLLLSPDKRSHMSTFIERFRNRLPTIFDISDLKYVARVFKAFLH